MREKKLNETNSLKLLLVSRDKDSLSGLASWANVGVHARNTATIVTKAKRVMLNLLMLRNAECLMTNA